MRLLSKLRGACDHSRRRSECGSACPSYCDDAFLPDFSGGTCVSLSGSHMAACVAPVL